MTRRKITKANKKNKLLRFLQKNHNNLVFVAGLIFIVFFFGQTTSFARAAGASLYLSPASGTHVINSTFRISIMVNSGGQAINATEGSISYDTNLLQVMSISKGNVFMFWTTEPSASGGIIKFGGGNPSSYNGTAGHVITVTFKAKKVGTAQVRFTSGAVLANDGKGTNILASMGSANYIVSPKVEAPKNNTNNKTASKSEPARNRPNIKSTTHPDFDKWYQSGDLKVSWSLPKGVSGVSIDLNQKSFSDPGSKSDGLFSEKEFDNIESGIWYVHVKFKDAKGWGTIANFKVMIDKNPPKHFKIKVNNVEVGDLPTLEFEANDSESGLDRYEIYVGSLEHQARELEADKKIIELSALEAGKHTVLVKAIDKAGNERVETVEFVIAPIDTPTISNYPEVVKPDNKFYMSGSAIASSKIIIYIEKDKQIIASSSVMSDANGNWFYLHNKKLSDGRYTSFVVAINSKGIKSGESARISFMVSAPVFAVIGGFIIDYFTVIVSLLFMIILIIFIILLIIFFVKKKLRKETVEIEDVLKRNLNSFRKDLDNEFIALAKRERSMASKKSKELIRKNLDKKLDIAEKNILKEVQDVEDILK